MGRDADPASICGLTSGVTRREAERTLSQKCPFVLGRSELTQREMRNIGHCGTGSAFLSSLSPPAPDFPVDDTCKSSLVLESWPPLWVILLYVVWCRDGVR